MKKTLFALFAVLLAVLMAACDDFAPSLGEGDLFTEDGRPMVSLTINVVDTSPSRTLTTAQALIDVDFYEVSFYSSTKIYRITFDASATPLQRTIEVPIGDYGTADKAILLAGTDTGKTLLAIGVLTTANGGGATTEITLNTTQVTFTVSGLKASITNLTTSSFKVTGPTGTPDYSNVAIGQETISGVTYPGTYPLYTFPGSTGGPATATYTVTCTATIANMFNGLKWAATQYGNATVPGYADGAQSATTGVTVSQSGFTGDAVTAATGASLTMTFTFSLTGASGNGYCKFTPQSGVYALNDTDAPTAWYIRGGSDYTELDGAAHPDGGSVLLYIGGPVSATIVIDPPGTPG
jgi:hypothetical protein